MGCFASVPAAPAPERYRPPTHEPTKPEAQPEPDRLAATPQAWLASFAPSALEQQELAPALAQCAALGVVVMGDLAHVSIEEMIALRASLRPVPRRKFEAALESLAVLMDAHRPAWINLLATSASVEATAERAQREKSSEQERAREAAAEKEEKKAARKKMRLLSQQFMHWLHMSEYQVMQVVSVLAPSSEQFERIRAGEFFPVLAELLPQIEEADPDSWASDEAPALLLARAIVATVLARRPGLDSEVAVGIAHAIVDSEWGPSRVGARVGLPADEVNERLPQLDDVDGLVEHLADSVCRDVSSEQWAENTSAGRLSIVCDNLLAKLATERIAEPDLRSRTVEAIDRFDLLPEHLPLLLRGDLDTLARLVLGEGHDAALVEALNALTTTSDGVSPEGHTEVGGGGWDDDSGDESDDDLIPTASALVPLETDCVINGEIESAIKHGRAGWSASAKEDIELKIEALRDEIAQLSADEQCSVRLSKETAQVGKITCSLMWELEDDLDLHCQTPSGDHIYYASKDGGGGCLDVDMQSTSGPRSEAAVENIYFEEPEEGHYKFWVNNYSSRGPVPFRITLQRGNAVETQAHTVKYEDITAFEFDWRRPDRHEMDDDANRLSRISDMRSKRELLEGRLQAAQLSLCLGTTGEGTVAEVAAVLKNYPEKLFVVDSHVDTGQRPEAISGQEEYESVTQQRAKALVAALAGCGVSRSHLTYKGSGNDPINPVTGDVTPANTNDRCFIYSVDAQAFRAHQRATGRAIEETLLAFKLPAEVAAKLGGDLAPSEEQHARISASKDSAQETLVVLGEKLEDASDEVKTLVAEGCVAHALADKYDVPVGMANWAAKATGAIDPSEVVGSLCKKDGIIKILESEETTEKIEARLLAEKLGLPSDFAQKVSSTAKLTAGSVMQSLKDPDSATEVLEGCDENVVVDIAAVILGDEGEDDLAAAKDLIAGGRLTSKDIISCVAKFRSNPGLLSQRISAFPIRILRSELILPLSLATSIVEAFELKPTKVLQCVADPSQAARKLFMLMGRCTWPRSCTQKCVQPHDCTDGACQSCRTLQKIELAVAGYLIDAAETQLNDVGRQAVTSAINDFQLCREHLSMILQGNLLLLVRQMLRNVDRGTARLICEELSTMAADRVEEQLIDALRMSDAQAKQVADCLTPTSKQIQRITRGEEFLLVLSELAPQILDNEVCEMLSKAITAQALHGVGWPFEDAVHIADAIALNAAKVNACLPEIHTRVKALLDDWVRSRGSLRARDDLAPPVREHIRRLAETHITDDVAKGQVLELVECFALERDHLIMLVEGDIDAIVQSMFGPVSGAMADALSSMAPGLRQRPERGIAKLMRAEETVEQIVGVLESAGGDDIVDAMLEVALEVGEAIPIAGNVVKLMGKFYRAAKAAETNREQCAVFVEQLKHGERMLGKANQTDLAWDEHSPLPDIERIIEDALEFVEQLRGCGFLKRLLNSKQTDKKLQELSAQLSDRMLDMESHLILNLSIQPDGGKFEQDARDNNTLRLRVENMGGLAKLDPDNRSMMNELTAGLPFDQRVVREELNAMLDEIRKNNARIYSAITSGPWDVIVNLEVRMFWRKKITNARLSVHHKKAGKNGTPLTDRIEKFLKEYDQEVAKLDAPFSIEVGKLRNYLSNGKFSRDDARDFAELLDSNEDGQLSVLEMDHHFRSASISMCDQISAKLETIEDRRYDLLDVRPHLPPQDRQFTGRAYQLETLAQIMHDARGVACVTAQSGGGKSSVLVEAGWRAHELEQKQLVKQPDEDFEVDEEDEKGAAMIWRGRITFVDLKGCARAVEIVRKVVVALGGRAVKDENRELQNLLSKANSLDEHDSPSWILSRIVQNYACPRLLLLDNVGVDSEIGTVLHMMHSTPDLGHLTVIVSAVALPLQMGGESTEVPIVTVPLEPLSSKQSVELLVNLAPEADERFVRSLSLSSLLPAHVATLVPFVQDAFTPNRQTGVREHISRQVERMTQEVSEGHARGSSGVVLAVAGQVTSDKKLNDSLLRLCHSLPLGSTFDAETAGACSGFASGDSGDNKDDLEGTYIETNTQEIKASVVWEDEAPVGVAWSTLKHTETGCLAKMVSAITSSNAVEDFMKARGLKAWHGHFTKHLDIKTPNQVKALTAIDLRRMANAAKMPLDQKTIDHVLQAIRRNPKPDKDSAADTELAKLTEDETRDWSQIRHGMVLAKINGRQLTGRKMSVIESALETKRPLQLEFVAMDESLREIKAADRATAYARGGELIRRLKRLRLVEELDEGRYRVVSSVAESMKNHAATHLPDADAVVQRHTKHCLSKLKTVTQMLASSNQPEGLRVFDNDDEQYRAVFAKPIPAAMVSDHVELGKQDPMPMYQLMCNRMEMSQVLGYYQRLRSAVDLNEDRQRQWVTSGGSPVAHREPTTPTSEDEDDAFQLSTNVFVATNVVLAKRRMRHAHLQKKLLMSPRKPHQLSSADFRSESKRYLVRQSEYFLQMTMAVAMGHQAYQNRDAPIKATLDELCEQLHLGPAESQALETFRRHLVHNEQNYGRHANEEFMFNLIAATTSLRSWPGDSLPRGGGGDQVSTSGTSNKKVLVMSCPEWGTLDPYDREPFDQKVMDKVVELQQDGKLKFGFDRAGTSTAAKEDKALWEEYNELIKESEVDAAKAKVRETRWFYGYQCAAKALIKAEMQGFDGVLVVLCIKGGPITQVEAEEMQRIANEATQDAAKSQVHVRMQLLTTSYCDFLADYG